jgi:hypothetical protein|tara:strand:+ start:4177 stop:6096 length:1920 start_codon:yes stop_codon:yes gene_type:complete
MVLQKMEFRPGINSELPDYANENGWSDGDKIRFREGYPEKIGGWAAKGENQFIGSCRALKPWLTLESDRLVGVGTHLKYYIEDGGVFYDITPIRNTTAAGDVTFSATTGSHVITVTDTNHEAKLGDFVTFSGAVGLGGAITADVLNQEYQIQTATNSTYTINARTANTDVNQYYDGGVINDAAAYVSATSGDTNTGGSNTVGAYQVQSGVDTSTFGNGWGAGTWSRGAWNSRASVNVLAETLRLWQHDTFGEDLIFCVRDGPIFYWDTSGSVSQRGVYLSALTSASNTPLVAKQVMVSDIDRHVIAFGCNPLGSNVQDPLLIRFSDQENPANWTPLTTNTAGDLRIGSGTAIVQAVETRQEILIFTDQGLHSMQFIGPPFTFGINRVSENLSIRSPNSAVAIGDNVYWMGVDQFYVYSGNVAQLNCTVKEKVLTDINNEQSEKIFVGVNSGYGEIWWFYPSLESDNIDKYVVYNYNQDIWYYGTLDRTAWIDMGVDDYPIAAGTDGKLYFHEFGHDDQSTPTPTAINAFVQSAPIDLGDGEVFSYVRKLIPDVTFRNSTNAAPTVDYTIDAFNYNGGLQVSSDTANIVKSSSVPIEQYTEKVDLRVRGRAIALKVQSSQTGTTWRLGLNRLDIRPDGKR